METPPTSDLLTKLSESLGTLLAVFASLAGLFTYLKYGRGKWVKLKALAKSFTSIPKVLDEIKLEQSKVRLELSFENNQTMQQKFTHIGDNLKLLRDVWTVEINTRRGMYRHADVAYFETDSAGHYIWVNDAYEDLSDKSLDDVKGKGWRSHIMDEDRYRVMKEWDRCVSEKRDFTMRCRYTTRKGDFVVIKNAVAIKDDEDNLLSFVGTVKKIEV